MLITCVYCLKWVWHPVGGSNVCCLLSCFRDMLWVHVAEVESVKSTTERFMSAVIVWLTKPHVVNRRLYGADLTCCMCVLPPPEGILDIALQLKTLISSELSRRLTA